MTATCRERKKREGHARKQTYYISLERADFMQTPTNQRENINAQPGRFTHRIGSTVYDVNVSFDTAKTESLEDKILRMMKCELKRELKNGANRGNVGMPQADKPPERGAA